MKNNNIISIVLFISVFMIFFACGSQETKWKGKIEEEGGVKVVKNPEEPIYRSNIFSLEEELTIGEKEGREEYMFSQIASVVVDENGRIYVSDWKESHIKVFDKKGKYLMTIGRKGQGPGEFERVNRIQITYQKNLLVFDARVRRLSFFSPDGELIKSKSISKIQAINLVMNSKGDIIVSSVVLDPATALAATAVKVFDTNLNLSRTIVTGKPTDVLTPFLPYIVWNLDINDNIAFGHNENYEFQILDSEGSTIKKIVKDYEPVEITKEEKRASLERLQQPLDKEVPRFHPAYSRFTFDDKGRIFVQTWEKPRNNEGFYYDVFDSEGKYIAKIPLKIRPRVWENNKLYTIEEDEDGYQYVKRYKVTWKY